MSLDPNDTITSSSEMVSPTFTVMNNMLPPVISSEELDLFYFKTPRSLHSDVNTSTIPPILESSMVSEYNVENQKQSSIVTTPTCLRRIGLSDLTNIIDSNVDSVILNQLIRFLQSDPDIRELLEKNNADCSFVLNKSQENLLTRRIIRNLVSDNKTLNKAAFVTAAHFIATHFREQSKEVYFQPCTKGKPPTGKLWYRYNNSHKTAAINSTTKELKITSSLNDIPIDEEQDLKVKLEWLRTNVSPFDTVRQYWKETYKIRENLYIKCTLIKYFEEFPVLTTDHAKELICIDFNKKYGKDYTSFSEIWEHKKQKVIDKLLQNLKSEDDKVLWSNLKNLSGVEQVVPVLWLLPSVIPASFISGKRTIDGKRKRPTLLEVRQSLFLHVKLASDVNEAIWKRRAELVQIRGTLQPTAVFIGPSLEKIESSHVLVNEVLYKCSSPIEAIELTFKSFFTFDTEYPDEGRQIWLFIQHYFCNIRISTDSVTVNFKNILKKLE